MSDAFSQSKALICQPNEARAARWRRSLAALGLETAVGRSLEEALWLAHEGWADLVFASEVQAGGACEQLLAQLAERFPTAVVSVLSQRPTVDRAVKLMRQGAFNYCPEPEGEAGLARLAREALEHWQLLTIMRLRQETAPRFDLDSLVGASPAVLELREKVAAAAEEETPVLLVGETGTGKELAARVIHHRSGREGIMAVVNCGISPSQVLEQELFGVRGGPPGSGLPGPRPGRLEAAAGGSLVLDEVGLLPPGSQGNLLRTLDQSGYTRVGGSDLIPLQARVMALTQDDLGRRASSGGFSAGLWHRLSVSVIHLPPLRGRRRDIPILSRHILEGLARKKGGAALEISREAEERFLEYPWPGNVRELQALLERMVTLCEGGVITESDLPPKLRGGAESGGRVIHLYR